MMASKISVLPFAVAVAIVVALAPACGASALKPPHIAAARSRPPKPPPLGAVVQARQYGKLAVGLAAAPAAGGRMRLTATALGPEGNGVDGLSVGFAARGAGSSSRLSARPCGPGCYTALSRAVGKPAAVQVTIGGRTLLFRMPSAWPAPSAETLVRRATRVYRSLRSVSYVERLSSGPGTLVVSRWEQEAPDRFQYRIPGGPAGIVIGTRRWDAVKGGKWVESQAQRIANPVPIWSDARVSDAHVLADQGRVRVVSFFKPSYPAWFTVRFDRRTLRPLSLEMTASAHFMHHTYTSFNRPLPIRPPR